ncbi:stalk domain-containing protein [Cohnella terricola]|nr:stalk domain-containing protein [Cohnella terricola]
MGKRSFKKLGILVCALLLAVIVGCQSVGGVNLNDMLLKQLDVSKQEQSQSFELTFDVNEELLAEEGPDIVKAVNAFKKVALNITESKVDEKGNQWMTGVFTFGKGTIPFTLHIDAKAVRIDVGGAKRSLVFELPDMEQAFSLEGKDAGESRQAIVESVRELMKKVASYFVKGLPNPPVISVDRVTQPIHGESTALTKVHAELNGEQFGELIGVYLDNLVKDREGFKAAVKNVYLWMADMPQEMKEAFGVSDLFDGDADLDEMTDTVTVLLFPKLKEAQKEYKEFRGTDDWKEAFDKGITMKADMYVDDSLHLRKWAMDINIAPAALTVEDSPIRSIKLAASGEIWNVNGKVEVPAVQVPRNALSVEELSDMQSFQIVRLFEEDSAMYDLLKNELHVGDQSFQLSSEWGVPFYVDSKGVAYVPIRSTLKEFGIRLSVPKAAGEIRFYDEATGQSFVLRKGSAKATVNGKSVTLAHKITADANFTYVSADDLFGLLGAEYEITEYEDGELVMDVTREL